MEKDKKKAGKLATYATVLLLMIILVIIIASMADSREKTFQTQIDETTQTNLSIQDEIITVTDENYRLEKKVEELEKTIKDISPVIDINNALHEVLTLLNNGDRDGAKAKFNEIDEASVPEVSKGYYDAVKDSVNN